MQLPSLLLASSSALLLAAYAASAQTILYEFDGARTVGIEGVILVQYASPESTQAKVFAELDFSGVDLSKIHAFDGNCTSDVVEYKWHIHVKWSSDNTSESLGQCSKALTDNHYDPLKACGPNSEFAATEECVPRIKDYKCNEANYAMDPSVCEKGDLSGKFGDFKVPDTGLVSGQWVDLNYPLYSENTPQWNMILHAVCGKATPRIACAVAQEVVYDHGYY